MRVLLLNLNSETNELVSSALAGQGYDVTTESGLTVDEVLALSPEVLVTEASPTDLSCCGMISQLKARSDTRGSVRILMVVRGGALERARALDLGADDVITFPFEGMEFAARVRTQFRERQPEEDLKTMLKYAVQREQMADIAVESLSGGAVGKHRFWLIPAIFVVSAAAILAAAFIVITMGRSQRETLRLRADIARLNSGLGLHDQLLQRTEQARSSLDASAKSDSATRNTLRAQSEDLRKKMATAEGPDAQSLKQQLVDTQKRLKLLENEGKIAETIVHSYGPSVCLLHVVVEFLDKESGKPIQIALDAMGKPQVDDKGMVRLDAGGAGPHLQIDVFGTGFLVRRDGRILTNHHVAEPWWSNDELKELLDHGAAAYVLISDRDRGDFGASGSGCRPENRGWHAECKPNGLATGGAEADTANHHAGSYRRRAEGQDCLRRGDHFRGVGRTAVQSRRESDRREFRDTEGIWGIEPGSTCAICDGTAEVTKPTVRESLRGTSARRRMDLQV